MAILDTSELIEFLKANLRIECNYKHDYYSNGSIDVVLKITDPKTGIQEKISESSFDLPSTKKDAW